MPSRNDVETSILTERKATIPEIIQREISVFPNALNTVSIQQASGDTADGYVIVTVAPQNVERLVELLRYAALDIAKSNEE